MLVVLSILGLLVLNGSRGISSWHDWTLRDGYRNTGSAARIRNGRGFGSVGLGSGVGTGTPAGFWFMCAGDEAGGVTCRETSSDDLLAWAPVASRGRWAVFSISLNHGGNGLPPAVFVDRVLFVFPVGTVTAARLRSAVGTAGRSATRLRRPFRRGR